jgi:pyruvate dehydrogenase E1 component alpha subunit
VLEVYEAAREAVERARGGGGPTLIESVSLRWRGHAGHDPAKYVPRELLEHYMLSKDPVKNFEQYLREMGVVDDDAVAAIDADAQAAFEAAHEYALASPFPEPGDVSLGVWVEDGYWEREPGRSGGTEAG